MVGDKWLLQTLSVTLERRELQQEYTTERAKISFAQAQKRAQREWIAAIAALEDLLVSTLDSEMAKYPGLILSGPAPVLSHCGILGQLHRGVFKPDSLNPLSLMPCKLLSSKKKQAQGKTVDSVVTLPLLPEDPLAKEQFCLVFTPQFALVMVLGLDSQRQPRFQFSFEPEAITQAWTILKARLLFTSPHHLSHFHTLVANLEQPTPDYRLVMRFSRHLIRSLPDAPQVVETRSVSANSQPIVAEEISWNCEQSGERRRKTPEVELLQALTHEIRTPLTTIRMLTRSLLRKRKQFTANVVKRLETIDQECTEQINRMELIFKAVELETTTTQQQGLKLTPMPLEQWLEQSVVRWQKQAQRRDVNLKFMLPDKLPTVVSNPTMLEQVLTGLLENFTRKLPTGSQAQVQITTAGDQLKLQLLSEADFPRNPFKSLGQLLMFQPETGSLSLNLKVTKNLLQSLGGKLTVRQRPHNGEVVTVFLPLGNSPSELTV